MSLQLTLVRHAKSDWGDGTLSDFERPLSARGLRDAPEMAERWRQRYTPPQLIVSSPARRALTTARIFADVLGLDTARIVEEARIYEAALATLLTVVRELPADCANVVLFGHNPGFSELQHALARDAGGVLPADVPTCAVTRLALDGANWSAVAADGGRVVDYDYPKRVDH